EIEPRAIPQSGAMRSGGLIEHLGIRFHRDWAARNLSRSEYHQLLDLRGAMHYAPSAPNRKFAHTVKRGTRNIELLVVLRFRTSYLNVLRVLTNFGIGPLASPPSFPTLKQQRTHGHPDDANDRRSRSHPDGRDHPPVAARSPQGGAEALGHRRPVRHARRR